MADTEVVAVEETVGFERSPSKAGLLSKEGSKMDMGVSQKGKALKKRANSVAGMTLEEINRQIAEVRERRKELTPNEGRVQGVRIDYSVRPKKVFHHPKLDFVIGEAVHSPYLTKPQDAYPQETFTMSHKLRDMKREGKTIADCPEEEKPFNQRQAKNKFIREVANFNPTYSMADAMAAGKNVSIRASTGELDRLLAIFNQGTRASAGGEYKSATMQAAEARGGPVKFKKQLSGLIARRTPSSSAMCTDDSLFPSEDSFVTQVTDSPDGRDPQQQQQQLQSTQNTERIRASLEADVNVIYGIEEFENEDLTTTSSEDKAAIIAQQRALINTFNKSKTDSSMQETVQIPEDKTYGDDFEKPFEFTPKAADELTRSEKLQHTTINEDINEEDENVPQLYQDEVFEDSSVLIAPIAMIGISEHHVDCVSPVPVLHSNHGSATTLTALPAASSGKQPSQTKLVEQMVESITSPIEECVSPPSYVLDALSPVDNSINVVSYDDIVGESVDDAIQDDTVPPPTTNGVNLEESYSHIEQIEYKDDFSALEESNTGNDSPIKNQVDNYVESPTQHESSTK